MGAILRFSLCHSASRKSAIAADLLLLPMVFTIGLVLFAFSRGCLRFCSSVFFLTLTHKVPFVGRNVFGF